jgi:hydrogenase maturation factor
LKAIAFAFVVLSFASHPVAAQEPAAKAESSSNIPSHFYRFDFVVKQIEGGRVINSRNYSVIAPDGLRRRASIRSGTRVPYRTRSGDWDFLHAGVDIDCLDIQEAEGSLRLQIKAEVNSVLSDAGNAGTEPPLLRSNTWESGVTIPLRKAVTIFASDDLASKQNMQLEITATPLR